MDCDISQITQLFQKLTINDYSSIKNDPVNEMNLIRMFNQMHIADDDNIDELISGINGLTITDDNIIIETKDYSKIIFNINNCTIEYHIKTPNHFPQWTYAF